MRSEFLMIFFTAMVFLCSCDDARETNGSVIKQIEGALSHANEVKLSDVVPFEDVCIFSQDDSDNKIAINDMNAYLRENNIDLVNQKNLPKNPQTILLFIDERAAHVYADPSFRVNGKRYGLNDFIYEEKRKACYRSEVAFIILSNNRLKIGEP